MTTFVAIVLLFLGLATLTATWNAARPIIDPTRRYSPLWLPAMVVIELAPFFVIVTICTLLAGLAIGGADTWGGLAGLVLLAFAAVLQIWLVVRSLIGRRDLRRRWIQTPIPVARGRARFIGLPVVMPPDVVETLGVEWMPGHTLDVVSPRQTDDSSVGRIFIYVHGGGWTRGDPQRQARDMYAALALDGWTVLALRYPFPPSVSVEEQIGSIRGSVIWARAGRPQSGLMSPRVVVAGGSAGGHLAAMAALTPASSDEQVDACVGLYGIYDMANRNRTRAPWAMIRNDVMFQTVEEAPERYREVSPIDRIHDATPPFLIVHGTHDTLVPIGEGTQFVEALRAADRPVDLIELYGAQHAFDGVSSPTSRTVGAAVTSWLRRLDCRPTGSSGGAAER